MSSARYSLGQPDWHFLNQEFAAVIVKTTAGMLCPTASHPVRDAARVMCRLVSKPARLSALLIHRVGVLQLQACSAVLETCIPIQEVSQQQCSQKLRHCR